jgi:DNA-binding IclR family transcriptional regulator
MADDTLSPNALSPEDRRAKYAVPALEKGLDIIELLADQAVPMTQSQLARALARQPSEVFRILTCLEGRGWLRRDPASGGYSLTLKLFELSRTHSPYEELLKAAQPPMRALAEELRESCHLSVLHRDRILVLAQEESPQPFRLSVEVGSLHDPTRTTSGRVLLANMEPAEREALLARVPEWTRRSAAERKALLARLDEVAARGFERAEGERFIGGLDLGVLVGAPGSAVKAALTIATLRGPEGRGPEGPDLDAMLPRLAACAEAIGQAAGLIPKG